MVTGPSCGLRAWVWERAAAGWSVAGACLKHASYRIFVLTCRTYTFFTVHDLVRDYQEGSLSLLSILLIIIYGIKPTSFNNKSSELHRNPMSSTVATPTKATYNLKRNRTRTLVGGGAESTYIILLNLAVASRRPNEWWHINLSIACQKHRVPPVGTAT